jgi:hypothetical protein
MLGVVAAPASSPLCLMEAAVEQLGARPVHPSPTLHFRPAPPLVDRPPLSHTQGWTSTDGTSWEMRVASEHCLAHPWDGTRQGEQMHIMGMRTACKACSPGVYLCALMLVFWCALAVYLSTCVVWDPCGWQLTAHPRSAFVYECTCTCYLCVWSSSFATAGVALTPKHFGQLCTATYALLRVTFMHR